MDRNLVGCIDRTIDIMSLSARRAWIEIATTDAPAQIADVALRKESVDRNIPKPGKINSVLVALRKESVDRNPRYAIMLAVRCVVALRKESVDRN